MILPSFIGVIITIFKDTSVLMAVGVGEITYVFRQMLVSNPADYSLILIFVIFCYWVTSTLLSMLLTICEKRLAITF